MSDTYQLPTIRFDSDDEYDGDHAIRGTILKFVDGRWSAHDGTELKDHELFLCTGTALGNQRFVDNVPELILKQPGEPLADVDQLNSKIDVSEWEIGLDGQPRPPWQRVFLIYLIRMHDASPMTYINSTVGARIAFHELTLQVRSMGILRGVNVVPLVKLSSKEMKTKHGKKLRPDFKVIEFREIGGNQQAVPQIEPPKTGKPIKPVTVEEELNDAIGF